MNWFRGVVVWAAGLVWLAACTGCADSADSDPKLSDPKPSKVVRAKKTETSLAMDSLAESKIVDPIEAAPDFVAPDLPPKATLLDPDMVWDKLKPDSFAISPDGQWIAYISKGAIWHNEVGRFAQYHDGVQVDAKLPKEKR